MSKKKIALLVGAALIVGVIALGGGAAYVFARESMPFGDGPPIPFLGRGRLRGGRGGMMGSAGRDGGPMEMIDAAAEAVDMTPEELFAELREGKTPQEILEEHDVDWNALHKEMQERMHGDGDDFYHGGFGTMGCGGGDCNPIDMFNAAAEAAGMTPEELFADLQAGKTTQEIMEEHDVDWDALHEEMHESMHGDGDSFHHGRGRRMGRMGGFGGPGGNPMEMIGAVAEELGMTPQELMFKLQEGKTPREIVEAQGLDPEQFFSELGQTFVAQAVEDGKLTQEQADWLLEGLEQGYVPMPMHHGEDGHWGPCGGEELPSDSE